MNFLETFENIEWFPNETWKLEVELKESIYPPTESSDISARNIPETSNRQRKKLTLPDKPNPKKYIPGKVFFPKTVNSCLTLKQQAICLNVLHFYQSQSQHGPQKIKLAQQQNIDVFNVLQSKIQEENVKFLEYVQKDWKEKRWRRVRLIKRELRLYSYSMWKKKLLRSVSYPQYYKSLDVIPLSYQDDKAPVEVTHVQNVLQLGTVAEYSPASLSIKYNLATSSLPAEKDEWTYNSKLPVSQDANVETLIESCAADVVISFSALKVFMDDSNYDKVAWDVPVVLKQHRVKQANGSFLTKKVVYVDKPMAKRDPSNVNFNEYCHKRLVRTNFCTTPEIVYPNLETKRENPYYQHAFEDHEEQENKNEEEEVASVFDKKTIHHNASYDIWKIKAKNEQNPLMKTRINNKEITFLVRHKVDGCERLNNNKIQPVFVVPKLEYQLEFGAGIVTKSELIRQWTSLFFRPFSHLYRVRMQASNSEVVSFESVSLQKLNNEGLKFYEYKPHLRLGTLYEIFLKLTVLEPGNYLLHHVKKNGPFAHIMIGGHDPIGGTRDIFDLHSEYSTSVCKPTVPSSEWFPVDVHYILPVHDTYKRMPGMFKPLLVSTKCPSKRKSTAKWIAKIKKNAAKGKKEQHPSPE